MIKHKLFALYVLAVMVPLLTAIATYKVFLNTYENNVTALETNSGKVAGDKSILLNSYSLPDNIPILENSQVLNYDSSDKSVSITYDTTATEEQIRTFYDKFLSDNKFTKVDNETYSKGNKDLIIKINENIVVLNYSDR